MAKQGLHGNPEAMAALAKNIGQFAHESRLHVVKWHANFEHAMSTGDFSDQNAQELFRRYGEARKQVDAGLNELSRIAGEMSGYAKQYADLLGRR